MVNINLLTLWNVLVFTWLYISNYFYPIHLEQFSSSYLIFSAFLLCMINITVYMAFNSQLFYKQNFLFRYIYIFIITLLVILWVQNLAVSLIVVIIALINLSITIIDGMKG